MNIMTPEQEKKLDAVYEIALRTEGKFDLVNEKIGQHREAILDHEKMFIEEDKRLKSLESSRDKVIGGMWVTCSTSFLAIIGFVVSLFRK